MTIETEAKMSAVVAAVRAIEPRIDTVPEKWQDIIASMVLAEIPFDVAYAKFSSVLTDAEKSAMEQRVTKRKMQENTESKFSSAISAFVLAEAAKLPESERPHVWRILVDYDSPAKNADGTPAMDADNNPVRETSVEVSATWTKRQVSESNGESSGATRGRLGGYLKIDGRNENFGSLKEVASALGVADVPNARSNINGAGYTIGTAETDADGKKFFRVTKTVAGVTA